MKKDLIIREINRQNTHWNKKEDFFFDISSIYYKRKIFNEIKTYLDKKEILSIVGLRRTGKTVLLKQLMMNQIEDGMDVKQIVFLSFDEALFDSRTKISDYIESALNMVSNKSMRVLFVIDEIQYAKNWQHVLKRYYDTDPRLKFIISGSSPLFLKKKTTESLAGRIYEFILPVLGFDEFLAIKGIDKNIINSYDKASIFVGKNAEDIRKTEIFISTYGDKIKNLFEEYIKYGQFPEIVKESEEIKKKKYLEEAIYRKTIEYDIPRIFGVEKIEELKFIFQLLISENGSIIKLDNIASEAGIQRQTLSKYLEYFQSSYLIYFLYNFSKSFRNSKKNLRKIYVGSTNFISPFNSWGNDELASQKMGFLVENYFFMLLYYKYRYVSFLRIRDKELDFVASNDLLNKNQYQYFEVKYRNEVSDSDTKFITSYTKRENTPFYIITKNTFKITSRCFFIPVWLLK